MAMSHEMDHEYNGSWIWESNELGTRLVLAFEQIHT